MHEYKWEDIQREILRQELEGSTAKTDKIRQEIEKLKAKEIPDDSDEMERFYHYRELHESMLNLHRSGDLAAPADAGKTLWQEVLALESFHWESKKEFRGERWGQLFNLAAEEDEDEDIYVIDSRVTHKEAENACLKIVRSHQLLGRLVPQKILSTQEEEATKLYGNRLQTKALAFLGRPYLRFRTSSWERQLWRASCNLAALDEAKAYDRGSKKMPTHLRVAVAIVPLIIIAPLGYLGHKWIIGTYDANASNTT